MDVTSHKSDWTSRLSFGLAVFQLKFSLCRPERNRKFPSLYNQVEDKTKFWAGTYHWTGTKFWAAGSKFWSAKSRVRLAGVTENAGRTCRKLSGIKQCSKLNQKSCQSCCLESQIINIKLKKSFKKVPSPPPNLSASGWRTGSNLEHWIKRFFASRE